MQVKKKNLALLLIAISFISCKTNVMYAMDTDQEKLRVGQKRGQRATIHLCEGVDNGKVLRMRPSCSDEQWEGYRKLADRQKTDKMAQDDDRFDILWKRHFFVWANTEKNYEKTVILDEQNDKRLLAFWEKNPQILTNMVENHEALVIVDGCDTEQKRKKIASRFSSTLSFLSLKSRVRRFAKRAKMFLQCIAEIIRQHRWQR